MSVRKKLLEQQLEKNPDLKIPETKAEKRELFMKLASAGLPYKLVDFEFPTAGGKWESTKLCVKVLPDADRFACTVSGKERLKRKGLQNEDISENILADATALEVLSKSICEPEPEEVNGIEVYKPIFFNADELSKTFSSDMIVRLFNLYTLVQAHFGLNPETLFAVENLNEWIDKVAEGANEFPLYAMPLPIVEGILKAMARSLKHYMNTTQLEKSQMITTESQPVSSITTEPSSYIEPASNVKNENGNDIRQISNIDAIVEAAEQMDIKALQLLLKK